MKRLAIAVAVLLASVSGGRAASPGQSPGEVGRVGAEAGKESDGAGGAPLFPFGNRLAVIANAFDAAKELGTVEAWNAFLASYPDGFYADLARAYVKKLGGAAPTPAPAGAEGSGDGGGARPPAEAGASADGLAPTEPGTPAVARGARYMGFPEKFNRYYTDPAWKAARTVYVSPDGAGDGAARETPASVRAAVASARPGTKIVFLRGAYRGGFEFTKANGGSYDDPVVLYGERNEDGGIGVSIACEGGRQTCFNFEDADDVAVDGFELVGGRFGVRAVGADYAASRHSRGIAVLNCRGHDQDADPFFSGHSDWTVWEGNVAYGAKQGDGHGIYISNGGDWNIVRFNETFANVSSDFQINADPNSTCKETGIAFSDAGCDAYAGTGEGGRGASDYFLVDSNYFHHGKGPGANFTSVRRSIVRNNIFGLHPRHNVSFWQETDNPRLGSSDNTIIHNLFVTTDRQGVQFIGNSTRNTFVNNVLLGVRLDGGKVSANPSATLMEVDDTVGANLYRSNLYVSGKIEGRTPGEQETVRSDFSADWFTSFPAAMNHEPNDFKPTAQAPFLAMGVLSADAPTDRNGAARQGPVDLGPIQAH